MSFAVSDGLLLIAVVWPWLVALAAVLLLPWWLAPQIPAQCGANMMSGLWPVLLSGAIAAIVLLLDLFMLG